MEPLGITNCRRGKRKQDWAEGEVNCDIMSTKSETNSTGISETRMTLLCCPAFISQHWSVIGYRSPGKVSWPWVRHTSSVEGHSPHSGLTTESALLAALPAAGRVKSFISEGDSAWYIIVSTTPHREGYFTQVFLTQWISLWMWILILNICRYELNHTVVLNFNSQVIATDFSASTSRNRYHLW